MAETAEETKQRLQREHEARQAASMPRMGVVPVAPVSGKAGEILQHLHPGEPVFILRAKDILSTFALDEYAKFVEKFSPHSPQLASIVDVTNDFRSWQVANPDKVKLPD